VIVRLLLPCALLAVCLWKARVNRLFLLGIPLLMLMGQSVFFTRMRPFWMPGRFEPQTHIMGWLFFVWLVIVILGRREKGEKRQWFGPQRLLPEEIPLALIAVIVAVQATAAAAGGGAPMAAKDLFYLLLGYMLVRGIVSRFSRAQVIEFLGAAVIANTIAAALYVAHQGFGLGIYQAGEYFSTTYGGVTITRTFTFMPQLTPLALGYVLAKPKWTAGWLVVLAITVMSVLVSYTRTLLVTVVLAVVIAVIARELRSPNATRFFKRVLVIVGSVALALALFALVLPVQTSYMTSRLSEFASASGVSDVGNWSVREFKYDSVENVVVRLDPLLGVGFPAPASNEVDAKIYRYSSDMAWIPILYFTGYVGVALFGLLLLGFGLRGLLLSTAAEEARRYLGMTCLIAIALTAVQAFSSWVFMQPQIAPMGLWILAVLAAEALRPEAAPERAGEPLLLAPAPSGADDARAAS
jgi:hypothetical protein